MLRQTAYETDLKITVSNESTIISDTVISQLELNIETIRKETVDGNSMPLHKILYMYTKFHPSSVIYFIGNRFSNRGNFHYVREI